MLRKKKKIIPVVEYTTTYTTPPADLLDTNITVDSKVEILSGADIARVLTKTGNPCTFLKVDILPNFLKYHFNFNDIYSARSLKKALSALSMLFHCNIVQGLSKIAHFSLIVPREKKSIVYFNTCLYDENFNNSKVYSAYLGISAENKSIILDFEKSPHVLIAGSSGSGKSTCLNTIINSLLYKATPHDIALIMIDPKRVEFNIYKDLPHLVKPVINDSEESIKTLKELCDLMDRRFNDFSIKGIKDISETTQYKHIMIIIDELADLMLRSNSGVEDYIVRLSQLGRAAGIHLIIATQRPTVKVITGLIKANLTTRIALQTASMRDSINILDYSGAEALTGKGDGLLKTPDQVEITRFQTAYIDNADILKIVDYWKNQK